jgi:hypothetical protein
MAEFTPTFSFTQVPCELECLSPRERQEQLMQYNLDKGLIVQKFRFAGGNLNSTSEYDQLLIDFLGTGSCMASIQVSGTPSIPIEHEAQHLNSSVMSMDFFDRLDEAGVTGPGGRLMGCYDEVFDGITVTDKLREMLLNEDSENAYTYSDDEKNEIIYKLFKLFVVGGSLCQADTTIERYLAITKSLYKELITVYRDAKTEEVQIAGRVYQLSKVSGLVLFQDDPDSPHNSLFLVVDPLTKMVTVLKYSYKPFW